MFDFIAKLLGGIFTKALESTAPQPPPELNPLPTQGIRLMAMSRAEEVNSDEWVIDFGPGKLFFNRYSWQSARESGVSFLEMLKKVQDNTFEVLYWLVSQPEIMTVEISSLWRPWSGCHTDGLAIDIGAIQFNTQRVYYYRDGAGNPKKDFLENHNLKRKLWATGKVTQIIEPWETIGLLGYPPGWRVNTGYSALDLQHRNHVHLSVRG